MPSDKDSTLVERTAIEAVSFSVAMALSSQSTSFSKRAKVGFIYESVFTLGKLYFFGSHYFFLRPAAPIAANLLAPYFFLPTAAAIAAPFLPPPALAAS